MATPASRLPDPLPDPLPKHPPGHPRPHRAPSAQAHRHGAAAARAVPTGAALDRLALSATLHCLSGCALGEVAGLLIGTALGWGNVATIALAVVLAFIAGFGLTARPLLRSGMPWRQALRLALAADALSITLMEIVDNGLMLAIPGAMDAPIDALLFWASMVTALGVAGAAAYPLNRWLIARGRGHAVVHAHHG